MNCHDCEVKDGCRAACQDLEKDLEAVEVPCFSGPLFSEMLIERVFPEMPKEETYLQRERRLRKERKARGKAIAELIAYFSAITNEEGKSLRFFLIWRLAKEESLSHREIADIMGISRQRISQIMNIIEGSFEKDH
jgi:hypothetical protein